MATGLAAQNNANRFSLTSAGQKYKSKVSTGRDPSGGSRGEIVRLLFQTLEAATIPWLVAPLQHHSNLSLPSSLLLKNPHIWVL